jgi:hypothetical protein
VPENKHCERKEKMGKTKKEKKPTIESVEFCYNGSSSDLEAFTLSAIKDYVAMQERLKAGSAADEPETEAEQK